MTDKHQNKDETLVDNRADVFEMMRREMEVMIEGGQLPRLSWAMNPDIGIMGAVRSSFDDTREVIVAIETGIQPWGHKFLFATLGLTHEQAFSMPFVFGHIFWTGGNPVNLRDGKHLHVDFDLSRGRIQLPVDLIKTSRLMIEIGPDGQPYLSPESYAHFPREFYPGRGSTQDLGRILHLKDLAACQIIPNLKPSVG